MRVLLVSNSGFQYLSSVVPALERNGAKFFSVATDDLRVHQKTLTGVKVRAIQQYYFDRPYLAAFRKVIEEFSPDVVHVTASVPPVVVSVRVP